ncbi:MAG: hypothetical protein JJT94_17135 [Bernardetiaceae bacterium]|nr:hypothetical protein [Bernardetiaceae bacterium]
MILDMKKLIPLFLCLLFLGGASTTAIAQSDTAGQQNFEKKRWGLARYIAITSGVRDTLYTSHNCQMLYIEFEGQNYQFSTYEYQEEGLWNSESDSAIVLKKANGKVRRRLDIMRQDADTLVLLDANQRDIFIEVYARCKATDTEVYDTRELYYERYGTGVSLSVETFESTVLGIGFSQAKWRYNNTFYAYSAAIEADPWRGIYGTSFTAWTQGYGAFGLSLNAYTDFENVNVGLKALGGISFKQLFGEIGNSTHIVYSYNFLFLRQGLKGTVIDGLNRHAITLRTFLPFKYRKKPVYKLPYE